MPRKGRSDMDKFRKKPVVIEAIVFDGTTDCADTIMEWQALFSDSHHRIMFQPSRKVLKIPTLEGVMEAMVGDWIIKGVKDEFYPCKPDIFEATYESADVVPTYGLRNAD